VGVRERSLTISLNVSLKRRLRLGLGCRAGSRLAMPRSPRGKRARTQPPARSRSSTAHREGSRNPSSTRPVACRSHHGASPTARSVGKRPDPSRGGGLPYRHVATAAEAARFAPVTEGFQAGTSVDEVSRWWLDTIARHRVRITTWTTYDKQLRVVGPTSATSPCASSDLSRSPRSCRTSCILRYLQRTAALSPVPSGVEHTSARHRSRGTRSDSVSQ
jgi:hypothetical protein